MTLVEKRQNGRTVLLTERDVATLTQISPDTLRTWRCRRVGPRFLKIGSSVRYRAEDIEAFLDARMTETAAA